MVTSNEYRSRNSDQDLAAEYFAKAIFGELPGAGGGGGGLTDTQLRASPIAVVDGLIQALTDAQLRATPVAGTDIYLGGEALADQNGANGVLTFTFAAPVQLVWVKALGTAGCRVDPFGGTPTSSAGIPCDDAVPNPITVQTTVVKVYAQAGVTVSVWGYRY